MSRFPSILDTAAARLEPFMDSLLAAEGGAGTPPRLLAAMRHAVLGGGKRFRPFLVYASAALFGVPDDDATPAAAALEFIHAYSLVHDDLPAMDNDEIRRGQPTVWKAYDEWTAILAGDALQTLAFQTLAAMTTAAPQVRGELIGVLAHAAGPRGMVGGQALDLEASHLPGAPANTAAQIARLQAMKTGALIAAGCEMGAILGRASAEERASLKAYGEKLGAAFQISDDLLDAEGHAAAVGKATGKDAAAGKATFISLHGIDAARATLESTVTAAIDDLKSFGPKAAPLIEAARFMGARGH